MENTGNNEQEIQVNKKIFEDLMNNVFRDEDGEMLEIADTDTAIQNSWDDENAPFRVYINLHPDTPANRKKHPDSLYGLSFPILEVEPELVDFNEARYTSPYGIVPYEFKDNAGQTFSIQNVYYLDHTGRSVKVETIQKNDMGEEDVSHIVHGTVEPGETVTKIKGSDIELLEKLVKDYVPGDEYIGNKEY